MARKVYMVDTENVSSSWRMVLDELTKNDVIYLFYTEHSPGIGYADFKEIMESKIQPEMISCYSGKNGLDFQLVSYLGYLLKSAGKTEYVIISNDMGYDSVIHFWTEQGYKVSRMTIYDMVQRKKNRLAEQKAIQEAQEAKAAGQAEASHLEKTGEEDTQEEALQQKKCSRKKKQKLEMEPVSVIETVSENTKSEQHEIDAAGTDGRKLLEQLLAGYDDIDVDTVLEILQHGSIRRLQQVYASMLKLFGHQTGMELYHVLKPYFQILFTNINETVTSAAESS